MKIKKSMFIPIISSLVEATDTKAMYVSVSVPVLNGYIPIKECKNIGWDYGKNPDDNHAACFSKAMEIYDSQNGTCYSKMEYLQIPSGDGGYIFAPLKRESENITLS